MVLLHIHENSSHSFVSTRCLGDIANMPEWRSQCSAAAPLRPVPDKYAFQATEKRTDERQHCV